MTRCQVCGRRIGLSRAGSIRHHHVRSEVCAGAGFPPIEVTDERLADLARENREIADRLARELADLYERRANWIDPTLVNACSHASSAAFRLERRLARHRAWPERFRREMERQGWGSPPPQYLVDRERDALDAQLTLDRRARSL